MKYRTLLLILFVLAAPVFAQGWEKYVAQDGSFSFVYPKGWKVNQNESFIAFSDSAKDEELLVVAIPFDAAKSPRQLAEGVITMFRSAMPDMTASEWKTTPDTRDAAVLFRAKYTNEGKKYDAHVIVVKDSGSAQALWFSFSGPLVGYDAARAVDILQKVVGSVSTGAAAASPDRVPAPKTSRPGTQDGALDRNAKAFLFVLEFSLGAPLTAGQERVILAELESGWLSSPAEELRKYDQYPVLVQAIMKAGQIDLESLRRELETSVREWIEDFRGKSESVRIIETELSLKATQDALRVQSTRDGVTGSWNHASILDMLQKERERARRKSGSVGVVLADLDEFRKVNESLGHPVGDEVLREAARRLNSSVRPYDAVGRYGGEEFLIVLPGSDGLGALTVAERIREGFAHRPVLTSAGPVPVTLSLGVAAEGGEAGGDGSALLLAAGAALARAQKSGRNRAALAADESGLEIDAVPPEG